MKSSVLSAKPLAPDFALLLLRITVGCSMLFGHGWDKMTNFEQTVANFPEFLGISPSIAVTLVILAEIGCSTFLLLGFVTRLSALPLFITMVGAIGLVHINSSFIDMELPLLYLFCYSTLLFLGPGKLSLDAIFSHQFKKKALLEETPDAW